MVRSRYYTFFAILFFGVLFLIFPYFSYASTACIARDPSDLKNCVNSLNSGTTDSIEINGIINCTQFNECNLAVSNIHRPVSIRGSTGIYSGFKRTDNFDYGILIISGSDSVTVSDLIFDESEGAQPAKIQNSTISISNSSNVILDRIVSLHSRLWAISILSSKNITLQNSYIDGSEIYGVWAPDYLPSQSLHLLGNTFSNIKSNAFMISPINPPSLLSTVSNNLFIHNHHETVFHVCGPQANGPCSGGQVVVEYKTDGLRIDHNIFTNGSIDAQDAVTNGIEFAPLDITNVEVSNNAIYNNSGYGIVLNPGGSGISNNKITDNILFNNAYGDVEFPGATLSNNCFGSTCPNLPPMGGITSSPNPCLIADGASLCTTKVSWYSVNSGNVKVKIGNSLFANAISGTQEAPWISTGNAVFDLIANDSTTLDSVTVRGAKLAAFIAKPADLNGDGNIDVDDYNTIIENFGKTGTGVIGDIDTSGKVDIFDYNELVGNFGK